MTLNQLARQAEAAEDKAAALLAEKEAQEATMADAVQAAQQLAIKRAAMETSALEAALTAAQANDAAKAATEKAQLSLIHI